MNERPEVQKIIKKIAKESELINYEINLLRESNYKTQQNEIEHFVKIDEFKKNI